MSAAESILNADWSLTQTQVEAMIKVAKFGSDGLLTAIAVDHQIGDIVMLAHMNEEALRRTLTTGILCYWSRSRQEFWVKGATSGNFQTLMDVQVDCDGDAWIFHVRQEGHGAACHQGYRSCFFRRLHHGSLVIEGEPVAPPTPHSR